MTSASTSKESLVSLAISIISSRRKSNSILVDYHFRDSILLDSTVVSSSGEKHYPQTLQQSNSCLPEVQVKLFFFFLNIFNKLSRIRNQNTSKERIMDKMALLICFKAQNARE